MAAKQQPDRKATAARKPLGSEQRTEQSPHSTSSQSQRPQRDIRGNERRSER